MRLAGNLPIELDYDGGDHFSHEMTLSSGTDGYVYMVWTIDGGGTSYESNYYYTLKDGKWQEVAGFGSDFHPDIYISQDVFSSTGYTTYWYSGPDGNKVELPYSTWNSRRQAVASGGKKTYELHGTVNTTLNTLSTRVDPEYASHYRTPSSWAAAAVEEGIDRGIIPKRCKRNTRSRSPVRNSAPLRLRFSRMFPVRRSQRVQHSPIHRMRAWRRWVVSVWYRA